VCGTATRGPTLEQLVAAIPPEGGVEALVEDMESN
jgi:hypothetical protein